MGHHRTAGRLAFVLMFVVVVLFGPIAAAEDPIPSITLDRHGPNQAIPTSKSFYIEGPAPTAEQVLVLFVRARWNPWGIGSRKPIDCDKEYAEPIAKLRAELVEGKPMPTADELARRFGDPIAAKVWRRETNEETTYKLLFDANSFFRPGARYCMVIVEQQRTTTVITEAAAIEAYRGAVASCPDERPSCIDEAKPALCRKLFKLPDANADPCAVTEPEKIALLDAIVGKVKDKATQQRYLAKQWPLVYAEDQPVAVFGKQAPSTALGGMIAELAVRSVIDVALTRGATPGEYLTADRATLSAVQIAEDDAGELVVLLWVRDDAGNESVRAKVPARALAFPAHTTTPLRLRVADLLDLWFNVRTVDGRRLSIVEAATADPAGTAAMLEAVDAALDITRSEFCRGVDGQPVNAGNPYCQLGIVTANAAWLAPDADRVLALATRVKGAGNTIAALERAAAGWDAITKQTETTKIEIIVSVRSTNALTQDLTQKAFFDQYITPVAGVSLDCVSGCVGGPLVSAHLGVQIYLWPNSYDEPMWINKREDVSRLFGIEIGLIPKTSNIGGAREVDGLGGRFAPMTFALAIQPIPYVTASVGTLLYGEHVTGLGPERYRTRAALHFAINLQGNIPGLIRGFFAKNQAL